MSRTASAKGKSIISLSIAGRKILDIRSAGNAARRPVGRMTDRERSEVIRDGGMSLI
ncbi:hypothetical protein LWF01_14030 [Saxibacter everestensis]|uniref:Uncharacterized protein n=1 Tax=Saxibacter everestensis TaxID=2909229 RepID=A0ABY8QS23_9MICO|nr:hypothetical protein LWF01_14030 [Brevibacteriaceae bacterium ZFBP1038]